MTEYGRRSWKFDDGGWEERRQRRSGPSPDLPLPMPVHGVSGFVGQSFQDRRPQSVAPAPPPRPHSTERESSDVRGSYGDDDSFNHGGRWVTLMGVPRDACLEVREFIEAHYGPTKAMFVAPPASAATASSSNAAGGFGGGGGIGFVNRHGMGDRTASGIGAGSGQLQECYLCFENAIHAEEAVRAGELHFCIESGAAITVARKRLANAFPALAGIEGARNGGARAPRRRHQRNDWHSEKGLGFLESDDESDEDDGIAGRHWVDISVVWCPNQHILPLLDATAARASSRKTANVQQRQKREGGADESVDVDGERSPTRRSATLLGDKSPSKRVGAQEDESDLPPEFVRAAAALGTQENTNFGSYENGHGDGGGGADFGSRLNISVLALFFASTTRSSVWLLIPRLLLLLVWTIGNFFSWALLGRRPTGVQAASSRQPEKDGERSSRSPFSSSSSSPSSARLSASTPASSASDYSILLHGHTRAVGRREGSARATPLLTLWRSLVSLSDGNAGGAVVGRTPPMSTSMSPLCLLSALFYSVFRSVAPTQCEIDLVLWSWLRLRSPHVQRNYQALRRRLRRLARAFSARRDTAVGVYGNLDEPFDRYVIPLSSEAFGWDGAFSDLRLFDDDYNSSISSGYTTRSRQEEERKRVNSYNPRDGQYAGQSASKHDLTERWLAGPPPLRVLMTWRPSLWITRYSVVSAFVVFSAVLWLVFAGRREDGAVDAFTR